MSNSSVKIWEEKVIIPTYKTSEPDKNPLFFEKRVYQGSSGKVYPLPFTEKIFDEKGDVEYNAVLLENDYLKIMLLPELGGRIQRAYDKTNDYDFIYYNHVIKPALVGLIGPWISGGIEFNWPQHHRPSTYMPTEHALQENNDGSKTVFISEIDQMYGTKGMMGVTLYPDKAYIEITGQLFNRTDTPQTFLWWANPAVPVSDYTYSVFPPDVNAVMDHGKRAVSSFPIATGTYYKYDYSAGVDISRYENIEVPTSYMAYHSDYDFIGNYDEKREAGLLHVADHNISPGKKQWTWGNGDFGQAWDRNLTDENGPYIELMTGVFTDNQPDFTWLKPYEEKTFTQYFMPYKGVGRVKNATKRAAINIELVDGETRVFIYASEVLKQATVTLSLEEKVIFTDRLELTPEKHYETTLNLPIEKIDERIKMALSDIENNIVVAYQGVAEEVAQLPEPAEELSKPEDVKSTEDLFLAATHIEQYRHATLDARDYYLEGLKRDETDIRLNNGYGMYLYKQGYFAESEKYFSKAVSKQTWKSPNPYYGEPLLNMGLVLLRQGKVAESYDAFYKATWNEDTQGTAFYHLACIQAGKEKYLEALSFIERSLIRNQHNMKARVLKAILLRLLGQPYQTELEENLKIDILDFATLYELSKLNEENTLRWKKALGGRVKNYLELAGDYLEYGQYKDALTILNDYPNKNPMISYYQAYICNLLNDYEHCRDHVQLAESCSSDYCFPNKLLEMIVLEKVIEKFDSSYAKYYLGNLYYDKKRHTEAIKLWEGCIKNVNDFPTVYRNLSLAYYNQDKGKGMSLELMEKAVDLDKNDARLLLELNWLKVNMGYSVKSRLEFLEERINVTKQRDDLFVEYITLLNSNGEHKKAYELIMNRQFHPWEGGEGKISIQFIYSLNQLALESMKSNANQAIDYLKQALTRPHNLGEGKLPNYHDNMTHYNLGLAYAQLGLTEKAQEHYSFATIGTNQPESVMYYNDQPADLILYMGLAYRKLNEEKHAETCFHKLISYGEQHLFDHVTYDYFAVSLPATIAFEEDLNLRNQIYCYYLMGLGYYGLEQLEKAQKMFEKALSLNCSHQGAIHLLNELKGI